MMMCGGGVNGVVTNHRLSRPKKGDRVDGVDESNHTHAYTKTLTHIYRQTK